MDEWYSPDNILEITRGFYGGTIDLDPASCRLANDGGVVLGKQYAGVHATQYYTKEDNGLLLPWHGNVWLNPPYSQPLIVEFIDKAIAEYEALNVRQILILTNNATETEWHQKLMATYFKCELNARLKFWSEAVEHLAPPGPLRGQEIWYLGPNKQKFERFFQEYGNIVCSAKHLIHSKEI